MYCGAIRASAARRVVAEMSSSSDNLQSWLATVKLGKFLAEADLIKLCEIVKGKLLEEPNIRPVSSPVTVCGDLHGQFYDVLELFKQGGDVERTKYIFLVCTSAIEKEMGEREREM